jgi:N-acetylglucosaminyl-diphospho-decaprenol L-rhamnosyltransferase
MKPPISIVIVNWNAGYQLIECIFSIAQYHQDLVDSVIVVDNNSSDKSLLWIDEIQNPPFKIEIIRNSANLGFGTACNQGAARVTSKYLLFLNPDTKLFESSLSKPIIYMEQPQNFLVGICGIQLVNEKNETSRSCARFPTPKMFFFKMLGLDRLIPNLFGCHFMVNWEHNENRVVDHVIGAFFLLRKELFDKLNGFDERFFVYLEDLDFSLRASKLGYASYYFADASAYHKGGGTSEQIKARRLFYSIQSRILYGFKHFSTSSSILLFLSTLFLEPLIRISLNIFQRSPRGAKETMQGYLALYLKLPKIISKALKN